MAAVLAVNNNALLLRERERERNGPPGLSNRFRSSPFVYGVYLAYARAMGT